MVIKDIEIAQVDKHLKKKQENNHDKPHAQYYALYMEMEYCRGLTLR